MNLSLNEFRSALKSALAGIGLSNSLQDEIVSALIFTKTNGYAQIEAEIQTLLSLTAPQFQYEFQWQETSTGLNYSNKFPCSSVWGETLFLELLTRVKDKDEIRLNLDILSEPTMLVWMSRLLATQGFATELRSKTTLISCDPSSFPQVFSVEQKRNGSTELRVAKESFPQPKGICILDHDQRLEHHHTFLAQGIPVTEKVWNLIQNKGLDSLVPTSEQSRQGAGE